MPKSRPTRSADARRSVAFTPAAQQQTDKATSIRLFSFGTPQMRAFHVSWMAFFLCFFAWFGIAPLTSIVKAEFGLTTDQIKNTVIASVAVTIAARLIIGWACDRFGPRLTYSALLVLGSLPVAGIALARDYESFLLCRLAIGSVGAAFVLTQAHTSLMFASNVVGTANATTAGWGNLGGGATQLVMPLLFSAFVVIGLSDAASWRACMVLAGVLCALTGVAYCLLTQDTPAGNFSELRKSGAMPDRSAARRGFVDACRDSRVWVLFVLYGACFGIELTINNLAALYFAEEFGLGLAAAGAAAALFGLMNIFARTLGGYLSDRIGSRYGLAGRTRWLFAALLIEGLCLMLFSRVAVLPLAIATLILFSLFVQMSEGATFAVVPFVNPKALGAVSGIVGAGGNLGAVAAGLLLKRFSDWNAGLMMLGASVCVLSFGALSLRFTTSRSGQYSVFGPLTQSACSEVPKRCGGQWEHCRAIGADWSPSRHTPET